MQPILYRFKSFILVRDLKKKWKQPIAYIYNNSMVLMADLASLLCKIISKVHETDLQIRCIICDQGATNITYQLIMRSQYYKESVFLNWKS